jgi:hypothetical protein
MYVKKKVTTVDLMEQGVRAGAVGDHQPARVQSMSVIVRAGANMNNVGSDKRFERLIELCPYGRGALT